MKTVERVANAIRTVRSVVRRYELGRVQSVDDPRIARVPDRERTWFVENLTLVLVFYGHVPYPSDIPDEPTEEAP